MPRWKEQRGSGLVCASPPPSRPARPLWVPSCLLQRFSLLAVLIPLDEVRAEWEKTSGPFHKQRVAEHCGIFRDLFKGATFTPWVALRVEYSQEDEYLVPVYYGNMVTPSEVREGRWEQPRPRGKPGGFCRMLLTSIIHSGRFLFQGSGVKEMCFLDVIRTELCHRIVVCRQARVYEHSGGALRVELHYLMAWLCPVCSVPWPCL